jgi:hypothetical protein
MSALDWDFLDLVFERLIKSDFSWIAKRWDFNRHHFFLSQNVMGIPGIGLMLLKML